MIRVSLSADILGDKKLIKELAKLDHEGIPRSLKRALAKTNSATRTQMSKSVRTRYSLKAKRIKQDIAKTTYTSDSMRIATKDKPASLRAYSGRMTAKGYSAMVVKGKRAVIRKGFLIKLKKGRGYRDPRTPFMREGRSKNPIRPIFGPSLYRIFMKGQFGKQLQRQVQKKGENVFTTELKRLIRFEAGSR